MTAALKPDYRVADQAALLRAGRFAELELEHLADEIEDLAKSEQRELASRVAVLPAHLIEWQYRRQRRGRGWQFTIRNRRKGIQLRLRRTPGLKPTLADPLWQQQIWVDAVTAAAAEADLDRLPETCPWTTEQALDSHWLPD